MFSLTKMYSVLLRNPLWLLTALVILAVLSILQIPKLQLDASGDSLVLEGDESLKVYRSMVTEYDSGDFLVVTYEPEAPIFSRGTLDKIAQMVEAFEKLEGVASVNSILNAPLLYSPPVSIADVGEEVRYLGDEGVDLELASKEFITSPIYKELLTSIDNQTTAIQINLEVDEPFLALRAQKNELLVKDSLSSEEKKQLRKVSKEYDALKMIRSEMEANLVRDVRAIIDEHRTEANMFLGGLPMIVSDMLDFVRSDMMVFGSIILVLIVVSLAVIFRAMRWIVLPLLTCLLTCIYMLGGIAFFGLKLTVISANFVALLLIITLSVTIHLVVRFVEYEKTDPEMDQFQLTLETMRFMIKPCVFTTLTTMVAFLSLIVSDIRPLIDFGWMMTVAVAVALSVGFFLLPCGLMLLPRRVVEAKPDEKHFTHRFAHLTEDHGRALFVAYLLVGVFSVVGISQLKVENRFIDYFDKKTEIYQGMLTIDEELGGTLPLDILLTRKQGETVVEFEVVEEDELFEDDDFFDDDFDEEDAFSSDAGSDKQLSYWFTRAGMQEIQQVHNYLDGLNETGKVLSLATIYEVVGDIAGGNVDDIQLAIFRDSMSDAIEDALVKPYLSDDGLQTRISVRVEETNRSLNRDQMLKDLDSFLRTEMHYEQDDYAVSGMMVLYNNMLQSLFSSQIATLGAVFLAIMIMFAILFRSFLVALLGITPNILAAFFVLGGMGWVGIPLDIMTITIAAITVGIGVDDTIHYIHRFKKEFAITGNYTASMYRSHGSIGKAMFYTSITIIAGFSVLALSNFTPSVYFGLLTGVAMAAALLGALILLPQLILMFKPFGPEKSV